jgi:hypothetical protein
MTAEADPSRLLVITPFALRSWADRPRRYFDPLPMPAFGSVAVGQWYDSDEQAEVLYFRRMPGRARAILGMMRLLWSHRVQIRQAQLTYCLDTASFAALLLLARLRVLDCRGKTIRRYCFHDSAVSRLAPMLSRAPIAFQVEVITRQQFTTAVQMLPPSRVVFRPWKIDAEWYQPSCDQATGPILLPGNASRDDAMVEALLDRGHAVTRAGRSEGLRERFASRLGHAKFHLAANAGHLEYRELLRSSSAVLLPILPCDDPAGLTAALEAISCRVPLLANHSMGLSELLTECSYPVPMLSSLDPDEWDAAIRQLQHLRMEPGFHTALEASRQHLLRTRSLLPDGGEWQRLLHEVPAP